MKKITFITTLFVCIISLNVFSQSPPIGGEDSIVWAPTCCQPSLSSQIISNEITSLNGEDFDFQVQFNITDSIFIKPTVNLRFMSPSDDSSFITIDTNPLDSTLKEDTFTATFTITYDDSKIPFYSGGFFIEGSYHKPGDTILKPFEIEVRYYFTPYNTLEIWDVVDFFRLKRAWLHPIHPDSIPDRIYVDPDSIPTSNISDDTADYEYEWQYEWNYTFIEGLAYAVPMMRIEEPVCINQDSCVQNKHDNCFWPWQHRYKYRLRGHVYEEIFNENGVWQNLDYSGLEIKFYEDDWPFSVQSNIDDFYMGKTTLNDNGEFSFNFDICEGERPIEVYMVVRAKSPKWDIVSKDIKNVALNVTVVPHFIDRIVLGPISLGSTNGTTREVWPPEEEDPWPWIARGEGRPRSVVYAHHVMEFVNDNLDFSPWDGEITIWQGSINTFFMPDELLWVTNPLSLITDGRTAIHLTRNSRGRENTLYHEMGHFLMWKLQGENWIDPLTGSFSSWGWSEESNPRITWTEGWADGFSFMCDMANFQRDQECNLDGFDDIEEKTRGRNPIPPNAFNRGFLNTASVAAALFDLYDGDGKIATYSIPTTGANAITVDDATTGTWGTEFDELELTFQQICQPIIDNPGISGKLHDIDDYFRELRGDLDCDQRRELKQVFDRNEVLEERGNLATGFSGDQISRDFRVRTNIATFNIFWNNITWNFAEDFSLDVNEINQQTSDFNLGTKVVNGSNYLSDDLLITDDATLFINNDLPLRFQAWNWPYSPADNSTADIDICSIELEVNDGGSIVVGDDTEDMHAEVSFSDGILTLGGNTPGNQGTLRINENSSFTVELGARLIVDRGGEIILDGDNAKLIIEGELEILDDVTFTFTGGSNGSGQVEFRNPTHDPENIIYHSGSSIEIVGTSRDNDVILVIDQEDFRGYGAWDATQGPDLIKFQNGTIEMGPDARIITGSPLEIRGVHIKSTMQNSNSPYSATYAHRGIEYWGPPEDFVMDDCVQYNPFQFNDNIIEHGKHGLQARIFAVGKPLSITNTTFRNNDVGMETWDYAVSLIDVQCDHNNYGWIGNGMSSTSYAIISEFNDNNELGISFHGNGGYYSPGSASLRLSETDVNNNDGGIYFTGGNTLSAYCGEIKNSNSAGIRFLGSNLDLSGGTAYPFSGRMHILDNNKGIDMQGGRIFLYDGKNGLRSTSVVMEGLYDLIVGDVNQSPILLVPDIDAYHNFWDDDPNNDPSTLVANNKINLNGYANPFPYTMSYIYTMTVHDDAPLTFAQVDQTSCFTSLPVNPGDQGWTSSDLIGDFHEGGLPQINTTSYSNERMDFAVESAFTDMFTDEPNN